MSNCADSRCPATNIAIALCPCSECLAARIPCTCPEGCDCLVCLVDSLSANPPPLRAVDLKQVA